MHHRKKFITQATSRNLSGQGYATACQTILPIMSVTQERLGVNTNLIIITPSKNGNEEHVLA